MRARYLQQARAVIQRLQGANLLRSHAERCRLFQVGETVEARYTHDQQWYKAKIVARGKDGPTYVIRWEFGSRPHMCALSKGSAAGENKAGLPEWSRELVESASVELTGSGQDGQGRGKEQGRPWKQDEAAVGSGVASDDSADVIKGSWDLRYLTKSLIQSPCHGYTATPSSTFLRRPALLLTGACVAHACVRARCV